jgi:ankyrin repeat protein
LGAEVNEASYVGETPLVIAANFGHETVVRALIEVGADINKAINDGRTPLVVAAHEDHETGADRGRRGHQEDDGWRLDAAVHRR